MSWFGFKEHVNIFLWIWGPNIFICSFEYINVKIKFWSVYFKKCCKNVFLKILSYNCIYTFLIGFFILVVYLLFMEKPTYFFKTYLNLIWILSPTRLHLIFCIVTNLTKLLNSVSKVIGSTVYEFIGWPVWA